MKKAACFVLLCLALYACSVNDRYKPKTQEPVPARDTSIRVQGSAARLADQCLRDSAFTGAVFISRNDSLLLCNAYGLAPDSTAYGVYTLAGTGTFREHFIATAILHLYARGKLRLQDPLTVFFDRVPAGKQHITVHQLLTHAAGFASAAPHEQNAEQLLALPVGQGVVHSNTHVQLLAHIVQKTSGLACDAYLRQEVLKGAGFDARSFTLLNDTGQGPVLQASVRDVYRWTRLLHKGRLLPDSLVQKMFTPQATRAGSGGLESFGYGCIISQTGRGKTISSPCDQGCTAAWMMFPDEGVTLYAATGWTNAGPVLSGISQLFFEGHFSGANNGPASFESKGAGVLYLTVMEKGIDYFTSHAFDVLRAQGLSGSDEWYFIEAGQKLIGQQKYPQALAVYQLATREFPSAVIAWNDLGQVYMALGKKEKARECFEQALRIKPDNERAQKNLEALQKAG